MEAKALIEEVKNRLVKAYHPNAIYIFGDYARGVQDEDSDLGILIVIEKTKKDPLDRPYAAYTALDSLRIAKEVYVFTKDEYERITQNIGMPAYQIVHKSKQIYAKS